MKKFKDFCSTADGLPPLWPFAPQWPFDNQLKVRIAAKAGIAGTPIIAHMGLQEEMDRRSNHLYQLLDLYKNSPDKHTVSEWVNLTIAPAGYEPDDVVAALGASTRMTSIEFEQAVIALFPLEHSSAYTPLDNSMRVCDACDKMSTSQCMCGAAYCSRECLRKNWANHRSTCKMICNNNFMGLSWMLNECEMRERLTDSQFRDAEGASSSASSEPLRKAGGTSCAHCHKSDKKNKKCSGCGFVHYCSKECQRSDWKKHKALCKSNSARLKEAENSNNLVI